MRLYKKD